MENAVYIVKVTRGEYAGREYKCRSAAAARRKCDRLDLQYGAICAHYIVRGAADLAL
jgi:hypothetical protein